MKLSVVNDEVKIDVDGMEYLRLKATLQGRIGWALKSSKSSLTFPTRCLPSLIDLLPDNLSDRPEIQEIYSLYNNHGSARNDVLAILEEKDSSRVSEFWRQRLDPGQSVAVAGMIVSNLLGLCLFDEQGSGKTVMTIAAYDHLRESGSIDSMIVVCPKSMISEWPKDFEKFLPGKYVVNIAEGNRQQKYETALNEFDVLVTNYEGVDPMQVVLSAGSTRKKYLLTVDESFYLKNADALRSDATRKLREACARCFVLCGTPAPNSAYDLVNQFDLADLGYTFGSFRKSRDEDADRDEISALIESKGTFIRRLKTEILKDVPDKNFHVISIPLKGKQALMYEKARQELELELRGLDNVTFKKRLATYFQKRSALLQICSNPGAIDPMATEPSVKMDVLDKLVEELVSKNRKVILWSFFRKNLDELEDRYKKYQPVRIDGSVSRNSRKEAVRLFQENPNHMIFIGNPAAAGAGITLHASYDAVYVSYSNQAAHYLQSLDRIHRRGQKSQEVNYYLLVCQGTIEETEVLRLRGKELQQHSILGDHVPWPSSIDEAIAELTHVEV